MKKLSLLLSTALLLFSCAKSFEASNNNDVPNDEPFHFSITAEAPSYTNLDTKAQTEAVARVKWIQYDVISVVDITTKTYLGDLTAQSEGTTTTFSGTLSSQPASGDVLAYIYPAFADGTSKVVGAFTSYNVDLSAQSFNKNAGTNVALCAYGKQTYSGTLGQSIQFQMATSYNKLNMATLPASTPITTVRMTNINSGLKWEIVGGDFQVNAYRVNEGISVACENTSSNADGNVTVNIVIPPSSQVESRRIIVNDTKYATLLGSERKSARFYNTIASPFNDYVIGEFTVNSEGKKVKFSHGNLYWNGSTFHFEDNQWDSPSSWSTSHVGHFYWSKSASVAYAETYSESGTSSSDVFFTNDPSFTVEGQTGKWRTLSGGSSGEWEYLLSTRIVNGGTGEGKSYRRATINSDATGGGIYGMIIYPDNYTAQTTATSYTSSQWQTMEAAGCVFIPAADYRYGSSVYNVGFGGRYWSSFPYDADAYRLFFSSYIVIPASSSNRSDAQSVRLVQDANTPAPSSPSGSTEKIEGEEDL